MNKNKLMVSRQGIKSKVGTSIRLDDGTMVYADGTIKKPDGTMSKLNNGESILLKNNSTNEITPNKNH